MATLEVTVTLDERDVQSIRALVAKGTATSVSGLVQHAVRVGLQDFAGWGAMLADALQRTGGPITEEERAWADGVLQVPTRRRRRNRPA